MHRGDRIGGHIKERQNRGARKGTHRASRPGLAAASHPKSGLAVSTLFKPVQHCAHGEASSLLFLLVLRSAPTQVPIPSHSKFMVATFRREKVEPFRSPFCTRVPKKDLKET